MVDFTLLGVNDSGVAVGNATDSSGNVYGFVYNTRTSTYTMFDDPSAGSGSTVENHLTSISNSGAIAGYFNSNGTNVGFVAIPL